MNKNATNLVTKQCTDCLWFDLKAPDEVKKTCMAFPEGIPEKILTGEFDHSMLYPEQGNDIIYEPLFDDEPEAVYNEAAETEAHYKKVRNFAYGVFGVLAICIGFGILERVLDFINSLIPRKLSGLYVLLGIYYEMLLNIAGVILTSIIVGVPLFFIVRLLTAIVMAIYIAIHAQWKKLP